MLRQTPANEGMHEPTHFIAFQKKVPNWSDCCKHLLITNVDHHHSLIIIFYDLSDLDGGDKRTWRCLGYSGWMICRHCAGC